MELAWFAKGSVVHRKGVHFFLRRVELRASSFVVVGVEEAVRMRIYWALKGSCWGRRQGTMLVRLIFKLKPTSLSSTPAKFHQVSPIMLPFHYLPLGINYVEAPEIRTTPLNSEPIKHSKPRLRHFIRGIVAIIWH